jgi:hypothetical protein
MSFSFVGDYRWRAGESFLDIASIDLAPDGTYIAQVEATLVNAAVRSFSFPCTLPESGAWTIYEVNGQKRIRLRPSTNKARVYVISTGDNGELTLARRGASTVLYNEALSAFANAQCA